MTAAATPIDTTLALPRGAALRLTPGGVERRASARATWAPVSLQELRRLYPAESPVWPWLRGHGMRRSDGGEHRARRVPAQLSLATVEAADALAERWGVRRGAAIERAVLAALGST